MTRHNCAAPPPPGQSLAPAERSLIGRIGAYSLHARGGTNTGPARAAFLDRFEREVDPEGVLTPAERQKRAKAAKSAYFTRLALKSAQNRKANTPR